MSQGQTEKNVQLVWPDKYISSAQIKCRNIIWYQNLSSYGSFHLLFDSICDPINVPSNYVPRTEKVKKSPDASCQTIFTMPLICNCQTKRDIAEWVCDVGKTLLMWLWFVRMVDEDLDVPPWSQKERRWGAEGGVLPMLMWWTSLTTWFRILMTNKITTEKIVCVG